ncbi:MAG: dipeptidase [Bacteroidales bacterium]|jgi:acetylornithine deacetylase/succinyl-diaminopimelate desuccinylase-like protein|nr:dipeptidase [Bacteroidales bacterium]
MQDIKEYIELHKERFLSELFDLLRIPSISSQEANKKDMVACAEQWKKMLLDAGADAAQVFPTEGHPIVFGKKIIHASLPTVLVYGHYDVMPVDPIEEWKSDPFEPIVKDDKIWARGADDDKGQSFMQAKAFEFMVNTNQLPCNVKFLLEGEEEIGSHNLYQFCEKNKEMLAADIILVSDTSMLAADMPSITVGLRGLAYWQIKVSGADRDLHSGLYGGSVPNPINILCQMLARATDAYHRVTIPHFYDDVETVSLAERTLMAEAPFDVEEYKKELNIRDICGEFGYSTKERTGIRPCFDICGIWGGYTGEGTKTVIPSEAYAKISTRLVPHQNFQKIGETVKSYFEFIAPKYVKVEVEFLHGGAPYVSPIDTPAYKAAEKALEIVYSKRPLPVRSGGSIPVISGFEQILGTKSILLGFGLLSDAIHSPNENYPLSQFYKGIEAIALFYDYFAQYFKENNP